MLVRLNNGHGQHQRRATVAVERSSCFTMKLCGMGKHKSQVSGQRMSCRSSMLSKFAHGMLGWPALRGSRLARQKMFASRKKFHDKRREQARRQRQHLGELEMVTGHYQ